MFQLTAWSLPPLAAAAMALLAYWRVSSRAAVPGGHALRFLFVALLCWAVPQAVETLLTEASAKLLASKLAYLGIVLIPIAWFQFALTYSKRVLKTPRAVLNGISIVPLATLVMIFTNDWHRLIWSDWKLVEADGYLGLVMGHGTWFHVHTVYSYALILIATTILVFTLTQHEHHRRALLAAIFAPLTAGLANLFYLSSLNPFPWFDVSTLGFLAAVIILDIGILQQGLLNHLPVVRDRVVELLKDPVLVIDHTGIIIDANLSALEQWPRPQGIVRTPVSQLVARLPLANLQNEVSNSEVTIGGRAYEVASTSLDASNPDSDVALVFRDVTQRRDADRAVREAHDKLERLAHRDALTSMFNRRYFMNRLTEEFERIRRHGSALSVLVFDLDHFKRINDTYGHDAGDLVLVAVARVANQVKRLTDVACRIGGEEFALLLPETDRQGAIQLAHRLRDGIKAYPYETGLGHGLTVTASVGVATVTRRCKIPAALLKSADRALYQAKNGGRNMVCFADN